MSKVNIVFWSGTGNTASMAESIAQGVRDGGKDADIIPVSAANIADLTKANAFALGCPSMGAEQLEESEMEPFMEALDHCISGKRVALFGSYGWGNEEWMRDWEARIQADGATVINSFGVTVLGAPTPDTEADLKALGKELAKLVD